jgi:hypothetical protein
MPPPNQGQVFLNGAFELLGASWNARGYYRLLPGQLSKVTYNGDGSGQTRTMTVCAFASTTSYNCAGVQIVNGVDSFAPQTTQDVQPTQPPPPPPSPPTNLWSCIRSCVDGGAYIQVRDNGGAMGIQCHGTNSWTCAWYEDAACTILKPLARAPTDDSSGVICWDFTSGWCREARSQLVLKRGQTKCAQDPPSPPPSPPKPIPPPAPAPVPAPAPAPAPLPPPPPPAPVPPPPQPPPGTDTAAWFDVTITPPNRAKQTVVSLNALGASPTRPDNYAAFAAGIARCRALQGCRLTLDPGVYRLATAKTLLWSGLTDFTFDGQGSTLLFTRINPPKGSLNIFRDIARAEFLNFNIDWDWNAYRLADVVKVVGSTRTSWTLQFLNWDWDDSKIAGFYSMVSADPAAGYAPGTHTGDEWFGLYEGRNPPSVSRVSQDTIRLNFDTAINQGPIVGTFAIIKYFGYDSAAIASTNLRHILLDGVWVNGAPGKAMTFGDTGSPMIIRNSGVRIPEGSQRAYATTADGLFLTRTGGRVLIENVEISRQADDCTFLSLLDC